MYNKKDHALSVSQQWRRHAQDLRELLDRQNESLFNASRDRDALLGLVVQWAKWRRGQCDCDETLSPQERALLERVK